MGMFPQQEEDPLLHGTSDSNQPKGLLLLGCMVPCFESTMCMWVSFSGAAEVKGMWHEDAVIEELSASQHMACPSCLRNF